MPGFQLTPGVLVDPDRREASVMSPEGGIVAVDPAAGAPVWHTRSADKPLTLAGELLVGQAEAPGPANALRIVTLDVGRRGRQVTEALIDLPPDVQPMIAPWPNRSFNAEARPEPGEAAISWNSSIGRCAASPLGRRRCSPAKLLLPSRPRSLPRRAGR